MHNFGHLHKHSPLRVKLQHIHEIYDRGKSAKTQLNKVLIHYEPEANSKATKHVRQIYPAAEFTTC